jgi:hypothetical protein
MEHIIPYLICKRKRSVLEEIAKLVGEDLDYICMNEVHNILSYIFLEAEHQVDEAISFFLSVTSYGCRNITVVELIKSCSLQFVTKLALHLGEEQVQKREKVGSLVSLQWHLI